jgi:beta-lactamase regulating signal transducer with metallopeptidase domain
MSDQVRVLEAAGLASPIAFGLFRPAVGLPHRFGQTFTPEQQDVMLAHELAHLAARDPFWRLLADLVSAALWWHPLVWVARHQLHSATEAAADEASLVIADGPTTLAECLVELGGRLTRPSSIGWLGIQGGGYRSALARRVERLLKLKQQPWSPPSRRRSALAMITLPAAFVIVALSATAWIIPKALRNSGFAEFHEESFEAISANNCSSPHGVWLRV